MIESLRFALDAVVLAALVGTVFLVVQFVEIVK